MTPPDHPVRTPVPSWEEAAEVLRTAASAVEAADGADLTVAAAARGDTTALATALERIAAACPGTLAVSVRAITTLPPPGSPPSPGRTAPTFTTPAHTDLSAAASAHADPFVTGSAHPGLSPAGSAHTGSTAVGAARTGPSLASSAQAELSVSGRVHAGVSGMGPGSRVDAGLSALAWREDVELPLASVGKVLLLAEVAMGIDGGVLDPDEPVSLHDDDYCGGSGLLPGLSARTWTVGDLALLTASVSDNTATNALLRRIGLDRVNAAAAALGLTHTRLLDRIREPRGPEHPPAFALGTAGELAGLAALLSGPEGWQVLMRGWMLANTDHGLVPAFMGHDPEGGRLANKTGTDDGVRADVGILGPVAYAVLASGPPGSDHGLVRAVRQAGALITAASRTLPWPAGPERG
ncbi:serine hydrolase [Nonomuraea ferruginea]